MALGLLLAAAGCGSGAPAADVAARVADRPVPYAEFEAYLTTNAIAAAPSLDSEVLSSLFDQFLDELLLSRLAQDEGFVSDGPRAGVAQLVEQALPAIEPEDVTAFYRANRARFSEPERVRVRQILVQDRATAELALSEVRAGRPFEDVARERSQGPRASLGGDQGVLGRDDLPPEIANQIFDLPLDQVSEIISADYGFHIFQVSERMTARETPLAAAEPEIIEELGERGRANAVSGLLERAYKRYNVAVYLRNLPFRYQGKHG